MLFKMCHGTPLKRTSVSSIAFDSRTKGSSKRFNPPPYLPESHPNQSPLVLPVLNQRSGQPSNLQKFLLNQLLLNILAQSPRNVLVTYHQKENQVLLPAFYQRESLSFRHQSHVSIFICYTTTTAVTHLDRRNTHCFRALRLLSFHLPATLPLYLQNIQSFLHNNLVNVPVRFHRAQLLPNLPVHRLSIHPINQRFIH